jgi:hypothetical protein
MVLRVNSSHVAKAFGVRKERVMPFCCEMVSERRSAVRCSSNLAHAVKHFTVL